MYHFTTKVSKVFVCLLSICLLVSTLSACTPGKGDKPTPSPEPTETYLAQNTIPASAKIYPIVDEEWSMTITNNADGTLTEEDIRTITHCVDLWCAISDTRGNTAPNPDDYAFLTATSLSETRDNMQRIHFDYQVLGTQILDIAVGKEDKNALEVTYMMSMQGKSDDDPEAFRTEIAALFFNRVNDTWYADAFSDVYFDDTDGFSMERDPLTNIITVKIPNKGG